MRDMKAHLERLRDQAAECAILSAEAETREKRELFAKLCADLTDAADHIQSTIDQAPSLKQGSGQGRLSLATSGTRLFATSVAGFENRKT